MAEALPHRLASILDYKQDEVAELRRLRSLAAWRSTALEAPVPRPFAGRIEDVAAEDGNALICEVKRRSPSAGEISDIGDPAVVAARYEAGGATCISVLTDGPSFGGELDDLVAVRAAVSLPVLRKDFMIDPVQVFEARAAGADAILLIMGALSDTLAAELCALAQELGMSVLVESHTADELERAVRLPSSLMGVNNRDLRRFTTDLGVTEQLATMVPEGSVLISESGIREASDVSRLRLVGARGFLIGEAAMRSPDMVGFVRDLSEAR